MRRTVTACREDWRTKVEAQGLLFHTNHQGTSYWDESVFFTFTPAEIERIEHAANELHQMFLRACGVAILENHLAKLGIPERLHEIISRSWRYDDWELYGRFDFTLTEDGVPKLIEYNADTPTGLLEASLIQWTWKEEAHPQADQFNSIHEALVARWRILAARNQLRLRHPLHLTSAAGNEEDRLTTGYLGETAEQAGFSTKFLPIDAVGWNEERDRFVDLDDQPIEQLFKLYPWEWMGEEPFSKHLKSAHWRVVEPPWKVVCTCKGILLLLAELFPGHPNLLPVSLRPDAFRSYARKPLFGREGANIELRLNGDLLAQSAGPLSEDSCIYQEFAPLIRHGENHAQLGVWMVGSEAKGMAIREDTSPLLRNTSRFVPHIIA